MDVTRRTMLVDAGLAAVVLGISLAMLAGHGFGRPGPGTVPWLAKMPLADSRRCFGSFGSRSFLVALSPPAS